MPAFSMATAITDAGTLLTTNATWIVGGAGLLLAGVLFRLGFKALNAGRR